MRSLFFICIACMLAAVFTRCKKKKDKLENPFGLLQLGSDTTLSDGRYVVRSKNGCGGWASTLKCDYIDEVIGLNGRLNAVDHVLLQDMDTTEVWYVKKVRYVSPDPDYALAFGYRIYQRMPDGRYRFLVLTATASTIQWTDDQIGFTFGDGGSKSVKAGVDHFDQYPSDPPVPTSFATSDDTIPEVSTRFIFQFYASKDYPGAFNIRTGGLKATSASAPVGRWNFSIAYTENNDCEISPIYPHFRSDNPDCEGWQEGGQRSRRCYLKDIYFQKVY